MQQEGAAITKHVRSTCPAPMVAGGFRAARTAFAAWPKPVAISAPTLVVGPHDDTAHVRPPEEFDRFTDSFVATYGGSKSKQGRVPDNAEVWSDHFPARLHAVPRDFGTCQYAGNVVHPALTSATGHAPTRTPAHRPH
ncbi:hypothetical protein [Burkholderia cepacia]|uniref:hypothetical protein n=1 Tax=Burkholderia cepacia TaxID=292 RepID=UPI0038B80227